MWSAALRAQAGIANGVLDAVRAGDIPRAKVNDLGIIYSVWLDPSVLQVPAGELDHAALFAVHPLHVESVAWVAERKDVLSTLFWMLTLLAYARYVECPRWTRYLPIVLAFALGLMAKQMLVTLPCVLLLLDYWPLGRWRAGNPLPPTPSTAPAFAPATLGRLVAEKVPLLLLAAGACVRVLTSRVGTGRLWAEVVPSSCS